MTGRSHWWWPPAVVAVEAENRLRGTSAGQHHMHSGYTHRRQGVQPSGLQELETASIHDYTSTSETLETTMRLTTKTLARRLRRTHCAPWLGLLTFISAGSPAAEAGSHEIAITEEGLGGDTPAVVDGPFGEDALTYSDRTHQHNGAAFNDDGVLNTAGGNTVPLPSYLVGSPYYRFANNARENAGYVGQLTSDVECYWYLLLDNRLDGPNGARKQGNSNTGDAILGGTLQWVIDGGWQRVNTGISPNGQADYTGLDEGGNAVGPGLGLNQFFGVWMLPNPSTSATVNGNGIGGSNMLSVVASLLPPTPANLTYSANPAVYTQGVAVTENAPSSTGGRVDAYSISPALPAGLSFDTATGVISGTPTALSPATAYTVTATNSGGSTTVAMTIAVTTTANSVAPSELTYSENPATYTKGMAITENTPSSQGDVLEAFFLAPALPAGLSFDLDTGVISGTPTALSAATDYTVTAANSGGSTTTTVAITVTDVAPSELTYSLNPATYTRGMAITDNTPSLTGGAVIAFSIDPALPAGLSFDTATAVISGTPTALSAMTDYMVTATNSGGSTTATVTITVKDAPPAELTYSENPAIYIRGAAITDNTPSSTGGAVVAYSIDPALPAGLSFDTGTEVRESLEVHYDFEGGSGNTVLNLADGDGAQHGTLVTTNDDAWQSGFAAGSLGGPGYMFFDSATGSDMTYVDTGLKPSDIGVVRAPYTMMARVRQDAIGDGDRNDAMVFGQLQGNALQNGARGNKLHQGHWSNNITAGSNTVSLGEWRHIAWVYDGASSGRLTIYVNGEAIKSGNKGGLYKSDSNILIGTTRTDQNRDFVGGLDDVRIYSEALSEEEIKKIALSAGGTGVISGMPTELSPATEYTVTATNSEGSTTTTLTITVKDVPPAELSYYANPAIYTKGFAISSNTPSLVGLVDSYEITPPLPAGLDLNPATGVISGGPIELSPPTNHTVTATNSAGSATVTLRLVIEDASPRKLSYAANPAIYTRGMEIAVNTPSSTGGAVVTYSIAPALPAGLSLDPATGVISGAPSELSAVTVYTVTATNSGGSATATVRITVQEMAPVELTYSDSSAIYTLEAPIAENTPSSTGGAVVAYSVTPALPAGLSLDPATGVISGTPVELGSRFYSGTVAMESLEAHYEFETGSGNTVLNLAGGVEGGAQNGTLVTTNDAAWQAGLEAESPGGPGYMFFDSANGAEVTYVDTGLKPSDIGIVRAPYTMMARVRQDAIGDGNNNDAMVFGQFRGNALHSGARGNKLYQGHWGNDITAGSNTVSLGEWRHIAWVYDGADSGRLTIYADGEVVTSGTKGGLFKSDHNILIGTTRPDRNHDFIGGLDDVRIFSAVLTEAEIKSIAFNASPGVVPDPPGRPSVTRDYTVIATNSGGSTTATVRITVEEAAEPPSELAYSANPATYTAGMEITDNVPSSMGDVVVAYSIAPELPAGLSFDTTSGVISGTPSALSAATDYTVTATNSGGSATVALSISVNDVAPAELTYATSPAIYTLGVAIPDNTPSSTGGAVVIYSIDPALPAGLSFDTGSGMISGTPGAASAVTDYTVTAINSGGSATVTVPITVTDTALTDVAPAELSYAINPAIYSVGVAITENTPSSSGGAVAAYAIAPSLPAGLSFDTGSGVISGVPAEPSEARQYSVTAANSGGSTTFMVMITVSDMVPGGLTYSTNPVIYTLGVAIPDNLPSSTGGAVVAYSIAPALPAGLSLDTGSGVISGTPSAPSAATDYTVTATNSGGSTTAVVTVTVNDVAPSALNYAANPAIYTRGMEIADNTPSSTGGAVVAYSVTPALPAGLSLDTVSGVISGTPGTASVVTDYTVTATNSGGSTTVTLRITVNDATLGLVAYWPLDEADGTSVADVVGSHNGTVMGTAEWKPGEGKFGGAIYFDGSDGFIEVPDASDFRFAEDQSWAVSLWYKADNVENNQGLITKGYHDTARSGDGYWLLQTRNGTFTFDSRRGSGGTPRARVSSDSGISHGDDQWHHFLVTRDGPLEEIRLYVDGHLTQHDASGTDQGMWAMGDNEDPLVIANHFNRFTLGWFDDIAIWKGYALTDSDVTAISEGLLPAITGAPGELTYSANPAIYTVGVAISDNAPSLTGGAAVYSIAPTLPAGLSLDTSSGVISGTPTEQSVATDYTVTATNSGGSATAMVTITVNTVAPSALSYAMNPAIYTVGVAISDNAPSSTGGAVVIYSIDPALPAGLSLDTASGVISGTPSALSTTTDYTVTATNPGGSTTAMVTITVNAMAPSVLVYSVNPAIYTVGVAISDNMPSLTGGAVVYSIAPTLPAGLSLDTSSGVISGTPTEQSVATDYTVTATNSGGSTTAVVTIAVKGRHPQYTNSGPFNVAENSANGTLAGDADAIDADGGAKDVGVTYVIQSGNDSVDGDATPAFGLDPDTGVLTVRDQDDLDHETQSSFALVIRATDGDGFTDVMVTIQVDNVPEAPVSTGLTPVDVMIGAADSVIDLATVFSDEEDADLSYSISSNSNAALFTSVGIDEETDRLILDFAPNISGTATLEITATDSDGQSVSASLVITVSGNALEEWRNANFSAADLGDPAKEATLWGNSANPDEDLWSNAFEFFFGTDPNSFDEGYPLTYEVHKGVDGIAVLEFERSKAVPAGVGVVEGSGDLSQWQVVSAPAVVMEDLGDRERVRVSIPLEEQAKQSFVRLAVDLGMN